MFRAQNQHGRNGHEILIILVFVPQNMRKAIQPMRQARDRGGIHPQKHEGILTFGPDALACEAPPLYSLHGAVAAELAAAAVAVAGIAFIFAR